MALYLVTKPARVVVDLDDMKEHLRVRPQDTEEDDLIEAYTAAITAHIDGGDGWLQRALIEQTWDEKLDCFPSCREIRITLPPLLEIVHIKYLDSNGVEQTFNDDSYHVVGVGGKWRAKVQLRSGSSWPVAASQWPEAVTIRFRAGYLDTSESPAPDNVPADIKHAIKLLATHYFEHRKNVVLGMTAITLPQGADDLLNGYRVY